MRRHRNQVAEQGKFLTEIEMRQIAPAVFSMAKAEKLTEKYTLIPTVDIVRGMAQAGFGVTGLGQTNARAEEKLGVSRHMIRFRKLDSVPKLGEIHPEIVLINSHDGTSCYQLRAGVFRLVCSNGMIASDEVLSQKLRHTGNAIQEVVTGAENLVREFPAIVDMVDRWRNIPLSRAEQEGYAQAAKLLRFEAEHSLDANRLLLINRMADNKSDLWTTFNRVQENMLRGGLPYLTKDETGRATGRNRTREVNSVTENNRLNQALWTLTQEMARIKLAA